MTIPTDVFADALDRAQTHVLAELDGIGLDVDHPDVRLVISVTHPDLEQAGIGGHGFPEDADVPPPIMLLAHLIGVCGSLSKALGIPFGVGAIPTGDPKDN